MTRLTIELMEKMGAFDQLPPPPEQLSAMVSQWPKDTPGAEPICTEAIRVFEGELMAARHVDDFLAGIVHARTATLPRIKRALLELDSALADTHRIGARFLAERLRKSDVDFGELLRGLSVLEQIADTQPPKGKQGRTKADATKAVLAAADVLMRHGIRRKRAARILEALMAVYPDVEAKTRNTIEQTIRNTKG